MKDTDEIEIDTNATEYVRWFNIGLECSEDRYMTQLAELPAGSLAYFGFIDGYDFNHH